MRERRRLKERERRGSERERERRGENENREGKEMSLKKQMCQNCMPTMNVNTLLKIWFPKEVRIAFF